MNAAARRKLSFTPAIAGWLLLDVAGMASFAAGLLFFVKGDALFVRVPTNPVEAGLCVLAGAVLMLIAAARLLRASLQQREARHES